MENRRKAIYNLTLSALFTAVGIVLPFLTGQIPQIGKMLLPMHLPVFLCGLICGWKYGLCVGAVLPLLRSLMFGMPLFYPSAVAMAFELAAYGFISGLLYFRSHRKSVGYLYFSLVVSMLAGRVVWAAAEAVLLGAKGKSFTFEMFTAGAFTNALPGIILQLVFIPAVMIALDRAGILKTDGAKQNSGGATDGKSDDGKNRETDGKADDGEIRETDGKADDGKNRETDGKADDGNDHEPDSRKSGKTKR